MRNTKQKIKTHTPAKYAYTSRVPLYKLLNHTGAHPKGGGLLGCSPSKIEIKTTYFGNTIISNVLRDLPFSRNQPLKLAEDLNIGILKNKIKNLQKP
jgi:hypothetical protein